MTETVRVLLGLGIGLAGGWFVGDRAGWLSTTAEIVGTLWVNAIRMTALPLVVALLVAGVGSVGDPRTIGRLGGRALALFVVMLACAGTFAGIVSPLALRWLSVDGATAAVWSSGAPPKAAALSLTQFLMQVIPVNPFQAAAEGTVLALVVFSVAFALALLFIEEQRRAVVLGFAQAVADAMLVLLGWVLWTAWAGIAALAFTLTSRVGAGAVGALGFYVVLLSGIICVVMIVMYPLVAIGGGRRIGTIARAFLPAQAVAASSRSSLAALPLMVEAAEDKLKLPRAVVGFVLPLAVSTFRISASMSLVVAALFAAKVTGLNWSFVEVATVVVMAALLSFSVPGIPNASFVMMIPLFQAVGLPLEPVGLLLAVDMIPDIFKTTLNVTGQLGAAVILSRGDGGLERQSCIPHIAE